MPLQNRVAPDGALHATPHRGTLMGNRGGRLHDPATRRLLSQGWRSPRWIACTLCFRGRHRDVMGAGYTELFFLDEVTALADGHRPCFECRRADALRFQAAWQTAHSLPTLPRAGEMDALLHRQRRTGRTKRTLRRPLSSIPPGSMIRMGETILAVHETGLLAWSFAGYGARIPRPPNETSVELLTPPAVVATLQAGYRPLWHASAGPC